MQGGGGPLSQEALISILVGIVVGTLARLVTLKEDYRQYPSFPNGYLIHVTTGFIAASLGAVAIPALVSKNFVAVTFLALAIQQFREIRKVERDSLRELDETEFAQRGAAYIDGIAKTFEARNYFALITSLITTGTMYFLRLRDFTLEILLAIAAGVVVAYLLKNFSQGKTVGDIASVELAELAFKDYNLYVDGIFLMNVGMKRVRQRILEEGYGVVITPNQRHYGIPLANFGQRQAIVHEAARSLGVKRYITTRRDFDKGRVGLMIVPIRRDPDALVEAIKKVPLLESTKKTHALMEASPGQGK